MKQKGRLLLVSAMLCVGSTWLLAQKQMPTHPTAIHGFVRDAATHAPLAHIIVRLDGEASGFVAQDETDQLGKFNFEGPGQAVFTVSVRVHGYIEQSQRVDLTVGSTQYVGMDLRPEKGAAPASTPAAGIVNAREKLIPEKARKEFETGRKLLLEKQDPSEVVKHVSKAIDLYHSYYDAYVLLAMAYIDGGKPADARSALEKAIQVEPQLPDAHVTLGMLLNHEKEYPAAEKSLLRGIELDPQASEPQYELAKTYIGLGRWQDAEKRATMLAISHPQFAPVHVLLGNIQLRKQDRPAAVREFKEYLRLDPTGPMAEQTRVVVNKLEPTVAPDANAPK